MAVNCLRALGTSHRQHTPLSLTVGPPRHQHLLQGYVDYEILYQRHLREVEATRAWVQARPLQQETHCHLPRNLDRRAVYLILSGELAKYSRLRGL